MESIPLIGVINIGLLILVLSSGLLSSWKTLLILAGLIAGTAPALANSGCEQAVRLQQQGLSVDEIAAAMGLSVAAVHEVRHIRRKYSKT